MNINNIFFRRKNKVIVEKVQEDINNKIYVLTMLKNLESYSYTFSEKLIQALEKQTVEYLVEFYKEIIKTIKIELGADVTHNVMYPNFPKQVIDMTEGELYFNALVHYISGGRLLPLTKKEERFPLIDNYELRIIEIGEKKEFDEIFENIINSKTSISDQDKEDLIWYMNNVSIKNLLIDEIPLKENIALLASEIIKIDQKEIKNLHKYFKTTTDVLRLAVMMSAGDVSLAEHTHFRNFKRSERKMLLEFLDTCKNSEDMLRHKSKWIKLGEKLHPGEYKKRYQLANKHFDIVRGNIKLQTYNSKVEEALLNNEHDKAIALLVKRPGEYARRLDHLLRSCEDENLVIGSFNKVAKNLSTTVLLQIQGHFKSRNKNVDTRLFFPKGNVANAYIIKNELKHINQKYCEAIVRICENALIFNYSNKEFLGNMYVSEELKNYLIPFSNRSANKALNTITRGSRLKLKMNDSVLRSFVYWKNIEKDDPIDIDASYVFYTEDWMLNDEIWYQELKNSYACHSGDIVDAPNGASEFIDIDVKKAKEEGVRYVIMVLNSYSEQPYCDLPICFAGYANRGSINEAQNGEIYEPKAVEQKFDIASNTEICIPYIFDLKEEEVIWCDLALNKEVGVNNVENNRVNIGVIAKAMKDLNNKVNLYELFMLHAKARGILVDKKEEADIIFGEKDDIKPTDIDIIIGQYL